MDDNNGLSENRFFCVYGLTIPELMSGLLEIHPNDLYAKCVGIFKDGKKWYAVFDRAVTLILNAETLFSESGSLEAIPYECACTTNTVCYECLRRKLAKEFMDNPIRIKE